MCKIADFGLSKALGGKAQYYYRADVASESPLPIRWSAPETIGDGERKFTVASDVYAFGVVAWEVVTRGALPFSQYSMRSVFQILLDVFSGAGQTQDVPVQVRDYLHKPPEATEWLYNQLVACCWHRFRQERPTFSTLLARVNTRAFSRGPQPAPALLETGAEQLHELASRLGRGQGRNLTDAVASDDTFSVSSRSAVSPFLHILPVYTHVYCFMVSTTLGHPACGSIVGGWLPRASWLTGADR